jgi:hypothetical protein
MLVEVLCCYAITTRRRLPREGNVTLEDLMRRASDFDVRTVTIVTLTSLRHLLAVAVGIITIITSIRPVGLSCSHDTLAFDGKVGSSSQEKVSEHVHQLDELRRSSVQRLFLRPGTLDGVVAISNSFLAQCPQKPGSSAPPPRHTWFSRTTPGREKASSRPSGSRHRYGCRGTPRSDAVCRVRSSAAQTGERRRAD